VKSGVAGRLRSSAFARSKCLWRPDQMRVSSNGARDDTTSHIYSLATLGYDQRKPSHLSENLAATPVVLAAQVTFLFGRTREAVFSVFFVRRISRPPHSTALPPLHKALRRIAARFGAI
jgi:hypothetical protein